MMHLSCSSNCQHACHVGQATSSARSTNQVAMVLASNARHISVAWSHKCWSHKGIACTQVVFEMTAAAPEEHLSTPHATGAAIDLRTLCCDLSCALACPPPKHKTPTPLAGFTQVWAVSRPQARGNDCSSAGGAPSAAAAAAAGQACADSLGNCSCGSDEQAAPLPSHRHHR
jgi:hypothetical protein